jgi:hypothetical protein
MTNRAHPEANENELVAFSAHSADFHLIAIIAVVTIYIAIVLFTNVRGWKCKKRVRASTRTELTALIHR